MEDYKILLIFVGAYLFLTISSYVFNRILKNTNNHCSFMGLMPVAPIGNIMCFFCRLKYFFMKKTWNTFSSNKKTKKENKIKALEDKRRLEKAEAIRILQERVKLKTKGLTDI